MRRAANRQPANRRIIIRFQPARWAPALFFLLLIAYWFFAHYVERIHFTAAPPRWWLFLIESAPPLDAFTNSVTRMAEFISWRVLRHFIPIILGWQLIRRSAIILLQNLYGLPDTDTARELLSRLRSGGCGPIIMIKRETLLQEQQRSSHLRIGGPARIYIGSSDVAITERNSRFHRVLGPGMYDLLPFERIYTVLDLQQQDRDTPQVRLFTQDGIELSSSLGLTFRIHRGGKTPTAAQPYSFDEEAARRAAYTQTVTAKSVKLWDDLPLSIAVSKLREVVAEFDLDSLLASMGQGTHENVLQQTRARTEEVLRRYGIELVSMWLGPLELPEAVTNQRIASWRAPLEKERQNALADAQIEAMEIIEQKRAEARVRMVEAIADGILQAQRESDPGVRHYMATLRLIEVLENIARHTKPVGAQPEETLPDTMRQLRELRGQLQLPPDRGQ